MVHSLKKFEWAAPTDTFTSLCEALFASFLNVEKEEQDWRQAGILFSSSSSLG